MCHRGAVPEVLAHPVAEPVLYPKAGKGQGQLKGGAAALVYIDSKGLLRPHVLLPRNPPSCREDVVRLLQAALIEQQ